MLKRMNAVIAGKLLAAVTIGALLVAGAMPVAEAHGGGHGHGDDHTDDHGHAHKDDDDHDHDHDHSVRDTTVDSHLEVQPGRAVFSEGHIDLNVLRRDDVDLGWFVEDETVDPSVWRDIGDVVIVVGDDALQSLPEDPAYDFIGAEAGAQVYVLDMVERPGLPWLGWSAEDSETLAAISGDVTVELLNSAGPGLVSMFIPTGVSGDPQVIWRSGSSEPQTLTVPAHSHGHGTWVFTESGIYTLEVAISATLTSGATETRTQLLRFAVGNDANPDDAFEPASPSRSELVQDSVAEPSDTTAIPLGDDQSGLVSLRWVALGALLLGLAVGGVVYRDRRIYNQALERDE